jgi:hypothetical protein
MFYFKTYKTVFTGLIRFHHANFKSNWNICTTPNLVLKIDCICYSKQQNILNLFYAYKLFKAMPIFKVTMSCLIHNWSNLDNKYFFHCFFSHGNLKLTLKYRKFNYYNINDFLRYKFFQMISLLVNLGPACAFYYLFLKKSILCTD